MGGGVSNMDWKGIRRGRRLHLYAESVEHEFYDELLMVDEPPFIWLDLQVGDQKGRDRENQDRIQGIQISQVYKGVEQSNWR